MPYKDLERHKEYQRNYQKLWRERNRIRAREIMAKHNAKRRGTAEYKLKRNLYVRTYTRRNRLLALEKYGGQCVCCFEKMSEFLTFDHVNGDGAAHRKILKSSRTLYMQLIKEPINPRFQILCWNCNLAKEKYKSCPHQNVS